MCIRDRPLVADGTPAVLSLPDGKVTIAKTTEHGRDLRFDYPAGRWLPGYMEVWPGDSSRGGMTAPIAISPDGQSYAYLAGKEKKGLVDLLDVHVRELASGRDRIVYAGLGHDQDLGGAGSLLGWSTSGIYVTTVADMGANPDVYLIDPSSRTSPRRVGPNPPIPPYRFSPQAPYSVTTANFTSINGGYAWGPGSDWHPSDQTQSRYHSRVLRMDLQTGAVETWYDGQQMEIVGFDSEGHPVLRLIGQVGGLLVLTGRNQTFSMPARANGAVFSDSHGMWLGDLGTLWLFTPGGQLLQIAILPKGFFPIPPVPSNAIQKLSLIHI